MKLNYTYFCLAFFCSLIVLSASSLYPQEPAASAQLPEVTIKGGEKSIIEGEKPLLQIEVDSLEAAKPILEAEEDQLRRQPELIRSMRVGFAESMVNRQLILPARMSLAREPIKIFYPLREIFSSSTQSQEEIGKGWEIAISNGEGRPFRKYSGKSIPPSMISWDGRSDQGEMMQVGQNYSLVILYKDTHRHARNFVGKPFSFDGIIHQEAQGLAISFSANALFEAKKDFSLVEARRESGMELLKEAADWIKRYYFGYPLKIESYSKNLARAKSRSEEIKKIIETLLIRPQGEISSNSQESENERVDIMIANR